MLTLPLMVIAARQAFVKQNKKRYNRTEYTIALVYSMVMVVLFRCVVSVLYLCSPQLSGQIGRCTIVVFFLSIVACFKTMMGYTLMKTAWRSLLTVILYYLLLGALLLVAVVVIGVVLAL